MAFELGGGLFAHQVDHRAQRTSPGEQAGRALDHFNTVVNGRVAQGIACRIADVGGGRRDAVVLEVADREPACVVVAAVTVIGRHGDAGGVAHHVVDVVEAEVVHVLTGHNGDRLRCFTRCQHQPGGGGDGAWRVGTRAFGHGTQQVAGDRCRAQFQCRTGLRHRRQHHGIFATRLGFKAAAAQQLSQGLAGGHGAVDARRGNALSHVCGVGDLQPALGAQLVQRVGQRLAGNRETVGVQRCIADGGGCGLDGLNVAVCEENSERQCAACIGGVEGRKVHASPE